MRVGVNVPNFGGGADPDSLRHWARSVEELGFDYLMVSDHVALTPEVQRLFPAPFYDPFTMLAWFAGITERIELGTTVAILPYRHPLLLARLAANIDQLSGGRFVLGVAAGWAAHEFAALGLPFTARGRMSDEYLTVIQQAWSDDVISHHGEFVDFDAVATGPRPRRRIPIWVGGHSLGALRRVVRHGDAWHPTSVSQSWLTEVGLPLLAQVADQEERPVPGLSPRIKLRITARPLGPERLLGEGTFEQLRADLDTLTELGAESVVLDVTRLGQRRDRLRDRDDLARLGEVAAVVLDLQPGRVG